MSADQSQNVAHLDASRSPSPPSDTSSAATSASPTSATPPPRSDSSKSTRLVDALTRDAAEGGAA